MALLGSAALAMWWDVAADLRPEFETWHSSEHLPERLGIPGFRRASRWRSAAGESGFFVMYELERYEVLSSAPYLERLNAPTPWSAKMMPHHRNMVRTQCRVLASRGSHLARHALTVRLSPAVDGGTLLADTLHGQAEGLPARAGLTGMHLLQHERPAIAPTAEQKMRGGDREADWVLVVNGYDLAALQAFAANDVHPERLAQAGAAPGAVPGLYTLSHAATAQDLG
jgi:hypothetical protein